MLEIVLCKSHYFMVPKFFNLIPIYEMHFLSLKQIVPNFKVSLKLCLKVLKKLCCSIYRINSIPPMGYTLLF